MTGSAVIDSGRLIAESTVEELRAGAELVVTASPADVARTTLSAPRRVSDLRAVGSDLRMRVDERDTAEVARELIHAGVDLIQLRREERQLEDVFFEITTSSKGATHD